MSKLASRVLAGSFLAAALFSAACVSDDDGSDLGRDGGTGQDGATPDGGALITRMYVHTADTLYLIDDQDFGLITVGDFNPPEEDAMNDLAVTPDGEIYTLSRSALYRVSRDNAQATKIADVAGESNVGMTFLLDGTLLATDKEGGVRKIDPLTGSVQELGSFGEPYATAGDLVSGADGRMFAVSDGGPIGNENENNLLITIDPATGAHRSSIGQLGFSKVFGVAAANSRIFAFTRQGEVIEVNPATGAGTLRKTHEGVEFFGAGVTPRALID